MKARWNGALLAESNDTIVVDDNHYFPPDSVSKEYFSPSATHTTCAWKGEASDYSIQVDGKVNEDAAWYYPDPKEEAKNFKGYLTFWKGVEITP